MLHDICSCHQVQGGLLHDNTVYVLERLLGKDHVLSVAELYERKILGNALRPPLKIEENIVPETERN